MDDQLSKPNYCGQECPGEWAYRCSLSASHTGSHIAQGMFGEVLHEWAPRSSSTPPPSDGNAIARITASLSIAVQFGQTDGAHHKAWVIDQMVRALTGDNYAEWVAVARSGEDGPTTFEWDKGVAP